MSKSIFEKLRELETDELRFPEIGHGDLDLWVEATSYMKGMDIDVRIREKLSGIGLVLENMRVSSSQDIPPAFFGGPCMDAEIKAWRKIPKLTYYTFRYDIAKVKPSDELWWIPKGFFDDPTGLGERGSVFAKMVLTDQKNKTGCFSEKVLADQEEQSQEDCPDCKGVGFYDPFVGPRETCKTCKGKK